MKHLVIGLFPDSKQAGEAVAALRDKGYAKQISLVSRDEKDATTSGETVKENSTDGAVGGAAMGAVMGGLTALIAGLSAVAIPGAGLLIAGPLATVVTGAVAGAGVGGIVGALVDEGIPENTAKLYQNRVRTGEVLVAVEADHDREADIQSILQSFGASSEPAVHANV